MSQPVSVTMEKGWLAILYDCLGQTPNSPALPREGVKREMHIHEQPHLVPPMKLVFYDEMPNSPLPPPTSASHRVSQWVSQGRELASRASDRTSLGLRRKISKQSISGPVITQPSDLPLRNYVSQDLPLRRRDPKFRPLELSIYLDGNRLSDLPEFTVIDFSDTGLIRMPPKALLRARSDDALNSVPQPQPRPSTSMISERQLEYWQRKRASTATSRPGSACEGLSSHPVPTWESFPGLAAKPALSPMVEEFEPIPSPRRPANNDLTALDFPPIEEEEISSPVSPGFTLPTAPATAVKATNRLAPNPRLNSFKKTRISQWLSRSSSNTSTINSIAYRPSTSITTTTSNNPNNFYQCTVSAGSPLSTASPALSHPSPQPLHASPIMTTPGFEFRFSRPQPQDITAATTATTTQPISHKPSISTSSTASSATVTTFSSIQSKASTHITAPSMGARSRTGTMRKGSVDVESVPEIPEQGMGVAF